MEQHKGTKILVVDDEPVARKVLTMALQQSKYDPDVHADGHQALKRMVDQNPPSIALIDWDMPGLSGVELCKKLRQHSFELQPYLIMLTARQSKTDLVEALEGGADEFISKPFQLKELQAKLRVATRHIERQQELLAKIRGLQAQIPSAHAALTQTTSAQDQLTTIAFDPHQIDVVVASALRHIGHTKVPKRIETRAQAPIVAWAGLLLPKSMRWVDILLEMDTNHLTGMVQNTSPATQDEALKFCKRLHSSITQSIQSVLHRLKINTFQPFPIQLQSDNDITCEEGLRFSYQLGDARFNLELIIRTCPRKDKKTEKLRLYDILPEPWPLQANTVPLLQRGVLTPHSLEKLRNTCEESIAVYTPQERAEHKAPTVAVHVPPNLALEFMQRGH